MNNDNMPNVGSWTVDEMGRATSLISNVLEMLGTETMVALMSGELRSNSFSNNDMLGLFNTQIEHIRDEHGNEALDKFVVVLEVIAHTIDSYMGDLMKGLANSGLVMPDPDNVTIPDTVPDDLGGPS